MPELPEVETIRRDLEPLVVGRRIVSTWCADGPRYASLAAAEGRAIGALRRRGKYLVAVLGDPTPSGSDDRELIVHLGMSGRLFMGDGRPELRHLRAVFTLDGPRNLLFEDMRKFGQLQVVTAGDYGELPTLAEMGPEPLSPDFDVATFTRSISRLGTPIKAALLGQKIVAGLGNIYVDEALFAAGIHPASRQVARAPAVRLHGAIRSVLEAAIANRGTTFSLYRDAHLKEGRHYQELQVYDRDGQPCPRCGAMILKTRIAGRGTHFCPVCQKAPKSRRPPGQ